MTTLPNQEKLPSCGINLDCVSVRVKFSLLVVSFILCSPVHAAQVSNAVRLELKQSSNLGSAFNSQGEISDASLRASYQRNYRKTVGLSQTTFYGVSLAAQDYIDYARRRAELAVQLGVDKKFGIGFYKPRLRLMWQGARLFNQSSVQNSFNSRLSLSISRPISEAVRLSLDVSREWQVADDDLDALNLGPSVEVLPSSALDRNWSQLKLSSDILIDSAWNIPVSLSHVRGDFESLTGTPLLALPRSDAIGIDTSLGDSSFVYRFKGKAWSVSVGATRILENGSSLVFGLNHSSTDANRGGRYNQSSFSVAWTNSW